MCAIKDVLGFICNHYGEKDWTLNKLLDTIFLADWKSAIELGKPMTDTEWKIIESQPQMTRKSFEEVKEFFELGLDSSQGSASYLLSRLYHMVLVETKNVAPRKFKKLNHPEIGILHFVLTKVMNLSDEERKKVVFSTYPSLLLDQNDTVDLEQLAKEYNQGLRKKLEKEKGTVTASGHT